MKKELNKEVKLGKFTFPPQEEFERVVQRISKSDKKTNIGLHPNAHRSKKPSMTYVKP